MNDYEWDLFVSYASEDKDEIVRPLAEALQDAGLRVWYDEQALVLGDSLRRNIDEGLLKSRHGLVVLSPSFFAKEWPRRELDGLASIEVSGARVILPIWHKVNAEDVRRFSPTLADRVACSTSRGLEAVASEIVSAVKVATPTAYRGVQRRSEAAPPPQERRGQRSTRAHPAPIRVAILKDQLKLLREVESFFTTTSVKGSYQLFGFEQVVAINGMRMAAEYALREFDVALKSPLLNVHCPIANFHPNTPVIPIDGPMADDLRPSAPWSDYFHWVVDLPPAFFSSSERLSGFLRSPLLPEDLVGQLTTFSRLLAETVEAVRTAMNECALKMPAAYPTAESLKSLDVSWIWNAFNKHAPDLSPDTSAILGALRDYYRGAL